jgi:hypothetical protein
LKPFYATLRKEYCWPCAGTVRARHLELRKGIA